VAVIAVLALAWAGWRALSAAKTDQVAGSAASEDAEPGQTEPAIVRLTPEKLAAAHLHTDLAAMHELREIRRVPAKIGYNMAHRLELKVPAAGVVKRVLAGPGQSIHAGDELAVLTSVEVGLARDLVNKAQADVGLAEHENRWASQIADNLAALLKFLDQRPPMAQVEARFNDKLLGDHREKVTGAYSKALFAQKVSASTDSMAAKGAISERLVQERTSTREVADAYFHSVCEQSRFDAQHEKELRKANLEHAERVLAVNQQRLRMLLGPFTEISQATDDATICELLLRAPFSGTVEERLVADGVQFTASQTLFVVANTATLWVSAQIYENEWAELSGGNVKDLRVECPALPGETMTARVQYIGTSMSAETRAVPLVAELPNPQRRLKPGMFAWVSVPLGPARRGLAVPAGALERHEHETFVFVELRPGVYRKRDVMPGLTTPDVVEIKSGLAAGDRVVDRGAFYLKSELLLEGAEP